MALFFWSDNLYNNKVDFDLHPGIHELPFKPVTMVIQHTVLLGLYGKLFHSYQFSSLVRFKTTSLNWISLLMKIDMSGLISLITRVIRYDIIPLSQVCLCYSGSGGENGWNWLSLILCPDHILDRTAKSNISKILVFHRTKMLFFHLGP